VKYLFAPGCALYLYKPGLISRLHGHLNEMFGEMEQLVTCCRHTPGLPEDATVINICPGCDRRYRQNYDEPRTVSLWELLAEDDSFPFPDYGGEKMTMIDACPTRDQDRVHDAVRAVAGRMNISIAEPEKTRTMSTCCGDTFFGNLPSDQVMEQMKKKGAEMPEGDIIVYCVSCSKSMFIAGRKPRYMVDLLFGEETEPQIIDPDNWHAQLDDFIELHSEYEAVSADQNIREK
jgi:hypothetical protein